MQQQPEKTHDTFNQHRGDMTLSIERWTLAVEALAQVVEIDACYLPIFERADSELSMAIAAADPLSRARALVQSNALTLPN
jgi:hypothetical protein